MTTHSGWCLTTDHDRCNYPLCNCPCHPPAETEGQAELIPDPRTTTEVPF